ncbi:MAG: ATP-binding protein, partial [Chthoniobacterales bacterium]
GPQLFIRPERYYSYLKAATPWIEEALIIPFGANGQIVGTFWVLKTQKDSHFDSEDLRLLTTLGNFAAAAYMIRIAMEKSEKLEASQKTALEIAEAANLSQDRFLAVLSHELRTPLTPVLMKVSTRIMDSETSSNMRADFMMIRRNIELQTRLIDDLLDLSGIRSGKLTLHKERVDLNEAIVQVQAICLSLVQERGIQMHVNLDVSNPIIDADAARIQQVLWNVIKNATKYTAPHGNIYITSHHTADGMAKIKIRDDGIGMEPGDIESIFTAFEQRDHHLGGLGLGLSISRAIVDMHGGNIHATSGGKGKGSEFTINLPMDFSKDAELKGENNEQSTVAKPLNVLIVEDHMDTAAVLMHLLKGIGHEVRAASTVKDALEIAKTHKFDLIISDLGLPDETGHTLMREIKKIQNIKGIAMSGYGMPEDIMKSLEAGFSAHIVKPFGMNLLEQTIRRITTSF